jgi:hypothetical protein
MEDVSPALAQYSRDAPLSSAEAMVRARVILDRLARLHTRWERPEHQATLRRASWLVPLERFLWCDAGSCAVVLGKTPHRGIAPGREVTDEYRASVDAILSWLPARDRPVFARLFCDREPLVAAMRALPRTLIHGDVGDRNLGLRPSPHGDETELVLIDWEWIGYGTPALDVAQLWGSFPGVHDLSQPFPEAAFTFDLPDYYFERYRAYGGLLLDAAAWRRACALAQLGMMMSQLEFVGTMIRYDVKPVLAALTRQADTLADNARSLFAA